MTKWIKYFDLDYTLQLPSVKFQDRKAQRLLEKLKRICRSFSETVALNASPPGGNARINTIVPLDEPDGLWSGATVSLVNQVNELADDLGSAIQNLHDRLAKKNFSLFTIRSS